MITNLFMGSGLFLGSIGFGCMFGAAGFFTFSGGVLLFFAALRIWFMV